ncbi:MAG: flippase-like domain-containing protein [Chloroflexi bacterium]|nr:flippase-like domain-containing protein [Chloroflexota bacterium]
MLKSRGFWIGIIVSLVFIGLFVRSTDFGEVKRAFEEANYWWVAVSMPVYFVGLWVRTVRWQYLLRPVKRVAALRLFPVVIVGLMANNLMPARTGEFVRAYALGARERVSKSSALGTIAVDRLFDGLTLVPMMFIVALFAGRDVEFPVGFGHELSFAGLSAVMTVLFGAALLVLLVLVFSTRARNGLLQLVHRLAPGNLKPKVEDILQSFFTGLESLRNPVDLSVAWIMSAVSWALEATMYYLIARGFGIHEPFHVFLLLTAAANLAIAVVASQGGVGPFELVVSKTVVAFGASSKLASAYAIGLHAVLLFPIIAIGLYLMWTMKLTFGDMLKSSDRGDEVPPSSAEAQAGGRVMRSGGTVKPERA